MPKGIPSLSLRVERIEPPFTEMESEGIRSWVLTLVKFEKSIRYVSKYVKYAARIKVWN